MNTTVNYGWCPGAAKSTCTDHITKAVASDTHLNDVMPKRDGIRETIVSWKPGLSSTIALAHLLGKKNISQVLL
jgi:hypothetical protein